MFVGAAALGDAIGEYLSNRADEKEPPKSITETDGDDPEDGSDLSTPDVEYPGDDPSVAPDGYEWTGPDPQGGKRGGYKNIDPSKRDSWHPDLDHFGDIGPHWDYNDGLGNKWRVFFDRIEFVPK